MFTISCVNKREIKRYARVKRDMFVYSCVYIQHKETHKKDLRDRYEIKPK